MRPTGIDSRLDDRADVVGVDVAIPQPVPAHHHDRVTQRVPGHLEVVDVLVGRREQEHHLVAGAGGIVHVVAAVAVEMAVQLRTLLRDRVQGDALQARTGVPVGDHRLHLGR